jgi:sugar/nucleoside kinase (ribokinase family)
MSGSDGQHWVAGPIAWDWACHIPQIPAVGAFVQATRYRGRPGGTAANVAQALASAGIDVELVGYVGDDEPGHRLRHELSGLGLNHVKQLPGPTSQVLLMIDAHGERTMIGLTPDRLSEIQLPVSDMRRGDTLYLASWVPAWAQATVTAANTGVRVVTVPPDADQSFAAHMIIGSPSQFATEVGKRPLEPYARHNHVDLSAVIVTRGAEGATSYTADGDIRHHPALETSVVDTTGAGDAFAAGVLVGCHETRTLPDAIRLGNAWGAATVATDSSLPPPRTTAEDHPNTNHNRSAHDQQI